jgi:hypothetical protein
MFDMQARRSAPEEPAAIVVAQKHKEAPTVSARAVTAQRAARLYRLLLLIRLQPQTRVTLTRKLQYDVRSFYRDIDLLRASGIHLLVSDGRYCLPEAVHTAIARLPFPDPALTLGEAQELTRGRTLAQRKLKLQITRIKKASLRKTR